MNIKIATSNTNQTPLAWNKNFHNISKSIEEAKREKVEILCFPELCITGYSCQDLFFNDWFIEKSNTYLKKIQKLCSNITVIIGHALKYNGKLYNSVCIIKDKKIKGFFLKSNIPNDGIHYEKRWFETWKLGDIKNFIFDDEEIFIGTIQFEYNDQLTIGFEICRDSWDDERPANYIKTKKKLLILNPIASHYAFNKFNFRKNQVIESSKKFNCTYISINLLGNESGKFIFEGDTVLSQKGKLLDVSNRFSFKDYILNIYSIDFNNEKKSFIYSEQNKYEEFNAAFSLALIDYLKKTRLKGFALSLSGGLDSSVTAILVYESLKRYTKELGFNNVIKKLKISNFNLLDDDRENLKMIMNKIFITVYQKTKNSSFSTKDSADKLSHFIGSKHYEWDIDTDVESIVSKISDNTKIKYNWDEHNLSLQNIQARVRSPFIWFIANSNNFLLLATSNRSELSVGYSTMDGDSSGSIAPIAGIDKIFIKRFLKYLKEKNNYDVLDYVLKLNPSAELKPLKYNQKDEDELMPYRLLTEIEYLAVKKRLSPKEILDKINGYDRKVILEGVKKFFTNYGKSQWKRERSAPSFHFDEYSLDSSLWNRMPILSNNFQEEIDLL
tara:strand:- start:30305 stop:32140 length:1836 start_codon:yes stop_codon:yes gene_type:complete